MRLLKSNNMTTTTSTKNFTASLILADLAGEVMLRNRLLGYFTKGKTSTFNAYYITSYEIPFLIKIRKDYISVDNAGNGDKIIRINMKGQKCMDYDEAEQKMIEFREVIGDAIEHYLDYFIDKLVHEDEGLFDE